MKEQFVYGTGPNAVRMIADKTELAQFVPAAVLETLKQTYTSQPTVSLPIAQHTRRRYPGGPVSTVDAHTRTFDKVKGTNMSTLPGRNFYLEKLVGTYPGTTRPKWMVRQFTFTGRLSDLKTFIKANANVNCKLRGPSGDAWFFSPSGGPIV